MTGKRKRPDGKTEAIAREQEALSPKMNADLSPEEARLMLHELRVHQIELEMQNDELRRVQVELDTARARYFDLYDLAPVGYCTLNEKGLILQSNLAASTLLGIPRSALAKQLFSRFILKEDQDIYYLHRKKLVESDIPQLCELRMVKDDGMQFSAHLAATTTQDGKGTPVIRIVMMQCNRAQAGGGSAEVA